MTAKELLINHGHKVVILYLFLRHSVKDVIEWIDDLRKAGKFIERRHTKMINLSLLADLPKDLALVAEVVPKIQAAIPLIEKNAAAISQAIADQKNPVAEMADINTLLALLAVDLQALASLLPAAIPAPVAPPAANG